MLYGDASSQRTPGLDGLELLPVRYPAADVKDDLAHGDAHGNLDQARILYLAGEGEDGCARASFDAYACEPISSVGDDLRYVSPAFHVVDIGGLAP